MATTTMRITEQSGRTLRELAKSSGETMQTIIDKAVEEYRRKKMFEQADAAYAALQEDPAAWEEYQKEIREWDCTLMDGLDPNERWDEDGTVTFVNKTGTADG